MTNLKAAIVRGITEFENNIQGIINRRIPPSDELFATVIFDGKNKRPNRICDCIIRTIVTVRENSCARMVVSGTGFKFNGSTGFQVDCAG